MIGSIRHKGLSDYWAKGRTRGLRPDWIARLSRIMAMLHAAEAPEDMNYPGSYFHGLRGTDRYSVRLTGNMRVTFGWRGEEAIDIDLEDYH